MAGEWRQGMAGSVLFVAAGIAACAPRGSSFETLGIPEFEPSSTQGTVILGWAREDRNGWTIRRVRIDGRTRAEWNQELQLPVVWRLEPGEHTLDIFAAQYPSHRAGNNRPTRRYRLRPLPLRVTADEAQLCVLRVDPSRGDRPQASCQPHDEYGEEAAGRTSEEETSAAEYEMTDEWEAESAEERPLTGPGVPSPVARTPSMIPGPDASRTEEGTESGTPPRRLSLEERVDRLERQLEALQRQLDAGTTP